MDRETHWQDVFRSKSERDHSWSQELPATSLALIDAAGAIPHG